MSTAAVLLCGLLAPPQQTGPIHTTYLWHLHQPIYWPDQRRDGVDDEYEVAWESMQQKFQGAQHPENDLVEIFSKDDRVAAYQWRVRDSIATLLGHPDAGAQVQYSGALTENVESLGGAFQYGYSPGWNGPLNEAKGWQTSGGTPRAAILDFAHHHALLPLQSERTQWLQIRMHQERMQQVWGIAPGTADGFFPPETAFTPAMIPVLADLGIEWVAVSNEHLSRACVDFPVTLGSGGVMCDPPNRADQLNPAQGTYWSKFIDRGCSPTNAVPFAYQPHRARWVDPETGAVSTVVVVPTAQALSWDDGYGSQSASALDGIASGNDPSKPMLVVLAHDGDNAWGGGYSYYMEAVPNFVDSVVSKGYRPSTVERYLQDFPVAAGDFVHVESGAWVNADSDFGSPTFTNWLYPLLAADGSLDPQNGWHFKAREYAVFTAAENRLRTAEDLAGGAATTRIDHVLDPKFGTTAVERGWHYYLASMDSGNVYYGNPLDMEVKGTVGCNEATDQVAGTLAAMAPSQDATEPTVFAVQRHPWNPGDVNFGAPYGYQSFVNDGSFVVWTFAYDVSGLDSAVLRWRADADGQNPLLDDTNELYAAGPGVGQWNEIAMDVRTFPAGNVYGWSGLESYAFEQPDHIAEHLSAEVPAQPETLLDYYVEVRDTAGNVARSQIHHVWIGDGSGAGPGGDVVTVSPDPPVAGQLVELRYDPAGGPLAGAGSVLAHIGLDGWQASTIQDLTMSADLDGTWTLDYPVPSTATVIDVVFTDGAGIWDNNGEADWHVLVVPAPPVQQALEVAPAELAVVVFEQQTGSFPFGLENTTGAALGWHAAPVPGAPGVSELRAAAAGLAETIGHDLWLAPGAVTLDPSQGGLGANESVGMTLDVDSAQLGLGVHEFTLVVANDGGEVPTIVPITIEVVPEPLPATGTIPGIPKGGEVVRIWYLSQGTALQGKPQVLCHLGFDAWDPTTIVDLPMAQAIPDAWYLDVELPAGTFELDFVFTDGEGTWDNNGGADWKIQTRP